MTPPNAASSFERDHQRDMADPEYAAQYEATLAELAPEQTAAAQGYYEQVTEVYLILCRTLGKRPAGEYEPDPLRGAAHDIVRYLTGAS